VSLGRDDNHRLTRANASGKKIGDRSREMKVSRIELNIMATQVRTSGTKRAGSVLERLHELEMHWPIVVGWHDHLY